MLLQVENLCKKFPRAGTEFAAVDKVSLAVEAGDFVTITGKSGSGKTTLISMLAGLLSPSSGSIHFAGKDLASLPDSALAKIRNREIGYVPQGASLLGSYTAFDNVRMPQLFMRDGNSQSERAGYLLESMGIGGLQWAYPTELSGGEMRRVAIARALFSDPQLLIADEPTSDLDPENTLGILDLFTEINKLGTTVIIVTHEESVAARGRRRFSMNQGHLFALGEKP